MNAADYHEPGGCAAHCPYCAGTRCVHCSRAPYWTADGCPHGRIERHGVGMTQPTWSAEREFEIRLHELVTGTSRDECRTDPTSHGRNGEPQFPLGGQAGHDYAPAYLTDKVATLLLIPEILERGEGFTNVDVYREESGDHACVIFGGSSNVFPPSTTTQRAMTPCEAIARAAFDWFKQEREKAI